MVETITEKGEIYLGGTTFPIIGKVHRSKASGYPSKLVIGDYTFDDEPILSNWIISDQRGGILVEEMDESIHADRCRWSNLILSFKNSLTLPRLATLMTCDKEVDPTSTTDTGAEWTDEAKAYDNNITNYAIRVDIPADDTWSDFLEFNIASLDDVRAIRYKCGGETTLIDAIDVDVFYNSIWNHLYNGAFTQDAFEIKALAAVTDGVTACRIALFNNHGTTTYDGYIYEVDFITESTSPGTPRVWANYNSNLYVGIDTNLQKLNATATKFQMFPPKFGGNILALVPSVGNNLYILFGKTTESNLVANITDVATSMAVTAGDGANFPAPNFYLQIESEIVLVTVVSTDTLTITRAQLGTTGVAHLAGVKVWDTYVYYQMDVAENFTAKNHAGEKAIHWDSKLFILDRRGQIAYSADPNATTPTWADNGDLADAGIADGEVNGLFIYFDADGTQIIYAATQVGLFAHDFTNAKWVETALALPQHANSGKGVVVWHDACFISSGLSVKKYIAGRTATISECGLDQDDGLPAEYQGEKVKFVKGDNEFFALVDASEATGVNYSGFYAYDGIGWQCWWVAATADKAMNGGIVSTAGPSGTRRVYYDHDDKIYYINLQRSIRKPKQISTFPYGASGIHLSPNFDANTAHNKLAVNYKIELKGITADETVIVKYRINHINTDMDTGWTTLATIDVTELGAAYGKKKYTFASNAGLVFRSIEFRYDLARGGTPTNSPEIIKASLGFQKLLPLKWGFNVTADCSKGYRDKTSAQLIAVLDALVKTQTLSEFTYVDDATGEHTYYIQVSNALALEETGRTLQGQYQIALVEP